MEKLLGVVGGEATAASDLVFDMPTPGLFDTKCFSLTKKQRLYGFVACFIIGIVISIFSSLLFYSGNLTGFGICYTFGNIIAIFSTAFIIGPKQQMKNMFHRKRIVATLFYITALIVTLVVAFKAESPVGVLIMVIVQCIALVWYTASYIPYARTLITKVIKSCF